MKEIKLLPIARACCKTFVGLVFIASVGLTIFFVHWLINPGFYNNIEVNVPENGVFSYSTKTSSVPAGSPKELNEKIFYLSELKIMSACCNYIQFLGLLYVLFLIFKECINIINSVEGFQTFRKRNVESLRNMGRYFLGCFVLIGIHAFNMNRGSIFSISVHITPLIFMLAAYIMSDIFKEGNNLLEENNLTI